MSQSLYQIYTFPNGLRFVGRQTDGHVGYVGVAVAAGSRDEAPDEYGLAHFVEHTVFKGTAKRSGRSINNRLESVGGELNAYTSKEETIFFANIPPGYVGRAIELLYDLLACNRFPREEVIRERDVVEEEICSYLDNPSESVFDEFEDRIYAGSGLGHNILGTRESVGTFGPENCRRFVDRHYRPASMVVYCASPEPVERVARSVERYFGRLPFVAEISQRIPPPPTAPFAEVLDRGGHQSHTLTGTRIFGRTDPRSHALFLLNNYLGGPGMSSLLNDELREKRGYVYSVESNVVLMSDCGLWTVYTGSDRKSVEKCVRLIGRTIERLASDRLSERRLERIKKQYIGQLQVASDHRESMALSMGKSVAFYGEVHDVDWIAERIRAVSADDIREVASLLAPFSSLTLC